MGTTFDNLQELTDHLENDQKYIIDIKNVEFKPIINNPPWLDTIKKTDQIPIENFLDKSIEISVRDYKTILELLMCCEYYPDNKTEKHIKTLLNKIAIDLGFMDYLQAYRRL